MFAGKYQDRRERKPQRLIILEGPDCAGKSTLARELNNRMEHHVVLHHGPYPRVTNKHLPRLYMEGMFPLLDWWQGQIMDRSWLSEQVYGPVYRGADRMDPVHRRHLERIALRHGAVVVRCLPDWDVVRTAWAARKGMDPAAEMLDNEDQLRAIYDGYKHLQTDLPVVTYDYKVHGRKLDLVIDQINSVGTNVHRHLFPTVGNMDAKAILIGEAPSGHTDADTLKQFPFCSFSGQGSSHWLTQQLIAGGIRELDLLWGNASDGLWWIDDYYRRPVIALGHAASQALIERDIPHHVMTHPQHHRRFSGKDDYPLITMLQQLIK